MDKHIEELIRIPEGETNDFLHTYRARFLPQKYDYKNQDLLRKYSNKIVAGLNKARASGESPSAVNKYLLEFHNERSWDYQYFEYCWLMLKYFEHLLPQLPLISRSEKDFLADLRSSNISEEYKTKRIHTLSRVFNRFSFSHSFSEEVTLLRAAIEEIGKTAEFEKLVIEDGIQRQIYLGRNKVPKSLRQCIFCYRFFEGVGRVPRTCPDNLLCKKADKAWRTFLHSKGKAPEDFGFF